MLAMADYIGSTTALLKYAVTSPAKEFIVATEAGILHQMQKAAPDKTFIPAPPEANCACNECPHMKKNTLEKVYLVAARSRAAHRDGARAPRARARADRPDARASSAEPAPAARGRRAGGRSERTRGTALTSVSSSSSGHRRARMRGAVARRRCVGDEHLVVEDDVDAVARPARSPLGARRRHRPRAVVRAGGLSVLRAASATRRGLGGSAGVGDGGRRGGCRLRLRLDLRRGLGGASATTPSPAATTSPTFATIGVEHRDEDLVRRLRRRSCPSRARRRCPWACRRPSRGCGAPTA